MKTKRNKRKGEQGVGLIVALLTLVLVSTLAAGLLIVTNTQTWTTLNYRLTTQARYAAEYGAEQTAVWIANNDPGPTDTTGLDTSVYPLQLSANNAHVVLSATSSMPSNYPNSSIQSSFYSALGGTSGGQSVPGLANFKYSTYATLLSMTPVAGSSSAYQQTWQITSQANITGFRNAQVQVTEDIQRIVGSPLFQYAIQATGAGCSAITLSGGAYTNSFDSSSGTYAATSQSSGGNIQANGNVNMSGGLTKVNGTLSDPNPTGASCSAGGVDALSASGGASVTGGVVGLTSNLSVPTPPAPSPAPPTTNETFSGNCGGGSGCTNLGPSSVALAPGTYGNITASGGTALHLSAGTYDLNSLTLSGGSPIVIDSGPVIINVDGAGKATAIDLSGGSIANASGIPMNCQINYGGTGAVKLSGGSASYGVVDVPNAAITFSGGSNWYGAVIGSTVNDSGGTAVHYDRGMTATVTNGKFQVVGFNWSKF